MSDSDILELVGRTYFDRGRDYANRGRVLTTSWNAEDLVLYGEVAGSSRHSYEVVVEFEHDDSGRLAPVDGQCTCPIGIDCKHVAAVLLRASASTVGGRRTASPTRAEPTPQWRGRLDTLLADSEAGVTGSPIGLQFEVTVSQRTVSQRTVDSPPQRPVVRVAMRPVERGKKNRWIRGSVSWDRLLYLGAYSGYAASHLRVLGEIAEANKSRHSYGYSSGTSGIALDTYRSSNLWNLLAQARAVGVEFLDASQEQRPVELVTEGVTAEVDLRKDSAGLIVEPAITVDGRRLPTEKLSLIGSEAHGVVWWTPAEVQNGSAKSFAVSLAPLKAPIVSGLRQLIQDGGSVRVPAADEAVFLQEYYPRLRNTVTLGSRDGSFVEPVFEPPVLTLTVVFDSPQQITVSWSWRYTLNGSTREIPVHSEPDETFGRDPAAEREVLTEVALLLTTLPELRDSSFAGPRLRQRTVLWDDACVRFVQDYLPALRAVSGVEVLTRGPEMRYRQAADDPIISIGTVEREDTRDWFDLTVEVSIGGEEIPFDQLFRALALGQPQLILASGTYFSLDRPDFVRLRQLIEEGRDLQDAPGKGLTISRFQAGYWDELCELGVVTSQAAAWRNSVDGLRGAESLEPQATPAGFAAQLRPYQQTGFEWLSFLHDHGLGGILADDMGLGKTVQTLALIARSVERTTGDDRQPFLIIAPTSVVANWGMEAARFVPRLRVVSVTETGKRRAQTIGELAADADVVVTSYTLFRLEYDEYATIQWAGLILDEAQMVKNYQTKNYQNVRRLGAGVKIAVTGTPLENSLKELWALLSIVAPGLFPSPARFTEYYQRPIEVGGDTEALVRLRRRIKPLMLRRTKEQVLKELPPKQEHVLELELGSAHRKIYDAHLQRERQKVLGLLENLDKNRFEIFRSLTLLRQLSLHPALVDDKHAAVSSAKLDAVLEILDEIVAEGHSVLIFSQFTSFLGLLRAQIVARRIPHSYLDGRTRKRDEAIARFVGGEAPVFLISLKAGGFGLNLTAADYVIMLDPWWNPATEAQAIDRAHRIGQTRAVMAYRMVSRGTIEEKVMALKEAKSKLFDSVMDADVFSGSALTAADIRSLLD